MVLCIVQARMGSNRLEGKVIKEINEKPMILCTLDRLKKSKYIDNIVLATSIKETENTLCKIVEQAGYDLYRGSEEDVLERYYMCNVEYQGDVIVRITGDCPLVDFQIVDNAITYFYMNNYDYVRLDVPDTFCRGFDVEVFSKEALQKAYKLADKPEYREHVTLYMYRNPQKFNVGRVKGNEFYNKNYRLCVDTAEDFALVTAIFEHFGDYYVSAREVVSLLDSNKDMANINREVHQKEV